LQRRILKKPESKYCCSRNAINKQINQLTE
jgi:biotin operon repressor